jgi:hypothetical protein
MPCLPTQTIECISTHVSTPCALVHFTRQMTRIWHASITAKCGGHACRATEVTSDEVSRCIKRPQSGVAAFLRLPWQSPYLANRPARDHMMIVQKSTHSATYGAKRLPYESGAGRIRANAVGATRRMSESCRTARTSMASPSPLRAGALFCAIWNGAKRGSLGTIHF